MKNNNKLNKIFFIVPMVLIILMVLILNGCSIVKPVAQQTAQNLTWAYGNYYGAEAGPN